MDTSFYHSLGAYEWDARCEMLAELGYDATYLTCWSEAAWRDVPRLDETRRSFGLDVAGVYVTLDLASGEHDEENHRIQRLIEAMEGCASIELSIRSSGPAARSDPAGARRSCGRW